MQTDTGSNQTETEVLVETRSLLSSLISNDDSLLQQEKVNRNVYVCIRLMTSLMQISLRMVVY